MKVSAIEEIEIGDFISFKKENKLSVNGIDKFTTEPDIVNKNKLRIVDKIISENYQEIIDIKKLKEVKNEK
jgi:flagellar motor switch protein FliM